LYRVDNLNILIAEDDYLVAEDIKRTVKRLGHNVIGEVADGREAVAMTKELYPDLILMDIKMHGMDGIEASRQIQKQFPTPIIILTAYESQDLVEKAGEIGINAYLVKPPKEQELQRTIIIAVSRFNELMEVKNDNEELKERIELKTEELHIKNNKLNIIKEDSNNHKKLAMTDSLTNLYNRRYFFDTGNKQMSYAIRESKNISIAMIDIDNFKAINDTYGHQAGDYVLTEFSTILKKTHLRTYDILGRYGGEEFIILFFDCNKEKAFEIINKIKNLVDEEIFYFIESEIKLSFSCGISEINDIGAEEISLEKLINLADSRMYKAKEQGKNRILIE